MLSIKEFVITNVKPEDYYASRFPTWNKISRPNIKCCFHKDNTPSLAIALRNGGAHCHATTCKKSIGNIVHFEGQMKDLSESIAARRLYSEFCHRLVSGKEVAKHKAFLAENTHLFLSIRRQMGLSPQFIRRFNLGYDEKSNRIVIPIYDQFGQCTNLRFYKPPSERTHADEAKIYNLKGYGYLELFPWIEIQKFKRDEPWFFMASEKEAMLAIAGGLQAFCASCGEGSWPYEHDHILKGKIVALVMDRDAGGTAATKKLKDHFERIGAAVHIIELKFRQDRKDRTDFADWILKEHHEPRELLNLIPRRSVPESGRHTTSFEGDFLPTQGNSNPTPKTKAQVAETLDEYPTLPEFATEEMMDIVCIGSRSDLLNKRIKTQGIVAARSPNTFSIPWRFNITVQGRSAIDYQIPMGRELLRFVRATDEDILQALQKLVGSNKIEIEATDYITVTQVEVIPIAVVERDVPYVVQSCFYFGKEIKDNVPYYLEIIPTSEIRTQQTLGIITYCAPISKTIDRFQLTPEIKNELEQFQPKPNQTVWERLQEVAHEISEHHTRVYNRPDWHMVALLSWACPIGWKFPKEPEVQRGWLNSLALGDTETGKSKVTKKLQELSNAGVFVNAENCTYVGLVGGAIKMGNGQLMLRWGRIPLSDKQLVVLEELSGLGINEISNMSEVRSSGIARLDKGGINANTTARTRLICLSNVRSRHKNLSGYLFGVKAIQELVGHGEDIARFDLITTLVDNEVSVETINSQFATVAKSTATLSPSGLKHLTHFVWSLTPDKITFTDTAYEECLNQTKGLSSLYHPSIPIFKGGSGRYKLGRIAAAIACLQFSYKASGITVTKEHVIAAVKLLRSIYDKPSFGYKQYSEQMFDREHVHEPQMIERSLYDRIGVNNKKKIPRILDSLIHLTKFSRDEFMAVCGFNSLYADQLISGFLHARIIRKGEANLWEITPPGKTWMEQLSYKIKKK